MLKTLPGYDPDIEKNRAEARQIMQKVGFSIAARVKRGPDYLMPTPFCASATDATRGSGFSSRSAPGRLMMG
jgi:hypothetical protein